MVPERGSTKLYTTDSSVFIADIFKRYHRLVEENKRE